MPAAASRAMKPGGTTSGGNVTGKKTVSSTAASKLRMRSERPLPMRTAAVKPAPVNCLKRWSAFATATASAAWRLGYRLVQPTPSTASSAPSASGVGLNLLSTGGLDFGALQNCGGQRFGSMIAPNLGPRRAIPGPLREPRPVMRAAGARYFSRSFAEFNRRNPQDRRRYQRRLCGRNRGEWQAGCGRGSRDHCPRSPQDQAPGTASRPDGAGQIRQPACRSSPTPADGLSSCRRPRPAPVAPTFGLDDRVLSIPRGRQGPLGHGRARRGRAHRTRAWRDSFRRRLYLGWVFALFASKFRLQILSSGVVFWAAWPWGRVRHPPDWRRHRHTMQEHCRQLLPAP